MATGKWKKWKETGGWQQVNKWQTLTFGRPPSINTAETEAAVGLGVGVEFGAKRWLPEVEVEAANCVRGKDLDLS